MSRKNFYAVVVGREPGIYESWFDGCYEQVNKFKGAIYKGFYAKEDAEAWYEKMSKKHKEHEQVLEAEKKPRSYEPKHKQKKVFFDAYKYEEEHGEPPF